MKQLVELGVAVGLLDRDDRITQLDQVFLLQIQQLLADLLGLFLRRKRDLHEISHLHPLHDFALPGGRRTPARQPEY